MREHATNTTVAAAAGAILPFLRATRLHGTGHRQQPRVVTITLPQIEGDYHIWVITICGSTGCNDYVTTG